MSAQCSKFTGYFAQIERLNQSGKSYENKLSDTLILYQRSQTEKFKFSTCWAILRNAPKYCEFIAEKITPKPTKTKTKKRAREESAPSVDDGLYEGEILQRMMMCSETPHPPLLPKARCC
jgi:hypothetical protein